LLVSHDISILILEASTDDIILVIEGLGVVTLEAEVVTFLDAFTALVVLVGEGVVDARVSDVGSVTVGSDKAHHGSEHLFSHLMTNIRSCLLDSDSVLNAESGENGIVVSQSLSSREDSVVLTNPDHEVHIIVPVSQIGALNSLIN